MGVSMSVCNEGVLCVLVVCSCSKCSASLLPWLQNGLSVKQLEEGSQGVLSYVSKRVSSIFFRGPSEQVRVWFITGAWWGEG